MVRRDKTINDTLYSLILPPVRQAMPLCTQVAVLVGPLLASLGEEASGAGLEAFASAARGIDPGKLDALLLQAVQAAHLCANEEPISDPVPFERHFSERREDLYPASLWVLWECVRDFFPDLGSLPPFLQKAAGSLSPTGGGQTTGSGGPSGQGSAPGETSATGA